MVNDHLITIVGGSGFIGTRLCQLMAERQLSFEIVDLKPSRRFPDRSRIADIRDIEAMRRAVGGNVIINLAAVHRDDVRDRTLYYSTNVDGTRNLCRLATERGIDTIVFTSTVAVYGFCPPDTAENGATNPFNDYGRSKLEGERWLETWHAEAPEARNLAILRPTVVFGEGNRGNVYNLLKQIAEGRFMMVGNGENRKSMAYVGNVAEYLLHTAVTLKGSLLVNYVDKPDLTMDELVIKVRTALGRRPTVGPRLPYKIGLGLGYLGDGLTQLSKRKSPFSSIRVKKFCSNTSFSTAAHNQPGFRAPFTLEDALNRTIDAEFLSPDPRRELFFTE